MQAFIFVLFHFIFGVFIQVTFSQASNVLNQLCCINNQYCDETKGTTWNLLIFIHHRPKPLERDEK